MKQTELKNAVMFGSRALGCFSEGSDYDFAILEKDLPVSPDINFKGHYFDVDNYLKHYPEGATFILKFPFSSLFLEETNVDLLVLKKEEDLEVVRKSMEDMKKIPKHILKDKNTRIELYQKCLENYGWKNIVDNLF